MFTHSHTHTFGDKSKSKEKGLCHKGKRHVHHQQTMTRELITVYCSGSTADKHSSVHHLSSLPSQCGVHSGWPNRHCIWIFKQRIHGHRAVLKMAGPFCWTCPRRKTSGYNNGSAWDLLPSPGHWCLQSQPSWKFTASPAHDPHSPTPGHLLSSPQYWSMPTKRQSPQTTSSLDSGRPESTPFREAVDMTQVRFYLQATWKV